MVGSTAGSDLGEQRDGPEIESEQSQVMSDVDSDLAPADWALTSDTPNATPSASACADPTLRSPPPPASVTQLPDKFHCDENDRMKVLAWDLDSEKGWMLLWMGLLRRGSQPAGAVFSMRKAGTGATKESAQDH